MLILILNNYRWLIRLDNLDFGLGYINFRTVVEKFSLEP